MAENRRFYWIKLPENFFKSLEMKKLRKVAGGDTYTIIYLKLMLMTCNTNGVFYFEGLESTVAEELALLLDEDTENVAITLQFLNATGLLEQKSDYEYLLTQVPSLVGSEGLSAERVRKYRQNKALKEQEEKEKMLQGNTSVTEVKRIGNVEKDIEIDIDKNNNNISSSNHDNPHEEIINYLNQKTGKNFKASTKYTQGLINARLKEGFSIDDFKKVIDVKCAEWGNDKKYSQYLQPSTLFAPSHFESYLQQALKSNVQQDNEYGIQLGE